MSEKSGNYPSTGGGGGGGGYRNSSWNKNSGWDKKKVNKKQGKSNTNSNKGGRGEDNKKYHPKDGQAKATPKREVILRPDLITLKVMTDAELVDTPYQSVVFQDYSAKSWVQCPAGEQRAAFNNNSMFYLVAKGTSKEDLENNNEVGREKLILDGKYCLLYLLHPSLLVLIKSVLFG